MEQEYPPILDEMFGEQYPDGNEVEGVAIMPTKEDFRKQVQVGMEYIGCEDWTPEEQINHLTDHLWGTVGMWLNHTQQEKERHVYPPFLPEDKSRRRSVDMIDEHEGEVAP